MKVGLRSAIKLRVNHLSIEGKETVNFSDLGMRSFLVKGVFSPQPRVVWCANHIPAADPRILATT